MIKKVSIKKLDSHNNTKPAVNIHRERLLTLRKSGIVDMKLLFPGKNAPRLNNITEYQKRKIRETLRVITNRKKYNFLKIRKSVKRNIAQKTTSTLKPFKGIFLESKKGVTSSRQIKNLKNGKLRIDRKRKVGFGSEREIFIAWPELPRSGEHVAMMLALMIGDQLNISINLSFVIKTVLLETPEEVADFIEYVAEIYDQYIKKHGLETTNGFFPGISILPPTKGAKL